jgi:peptide/nickel transport system ATP-binding protein
VSTGERLLSVSGLTVSLSSDVPIIEDVDIGVRKGEILGLVGESGSGKSTLALAMLGFTRAGARISKGEVVVGGQPMVGPPERELRRLRGRLVSYVPQDPQSSLNPGRRIIDQLRDRIRDRDKSEWRRLIELALDRAQLPHTDEFLTRFPHQLSGGQQQRSLIAMAIVGEPSLVVLDEPTTGLDVVTQAGLLREIVGLRDSLEIGVVYVTHDVAAVASIADSIAVMYAGRLVEQGRGADMLRRPHHPYTVGLLESVPDHTRPVQLKGLPGVAVGVGEWPPGCAFAPRCPQANGDCVAGLPRLEESSSTDHLVRCIHWRQTPEPVYLGDSRVRAASDGAAVLTVTGLRATYRSRRAAEVVAAEDVSFSVSPGECLALVGESGSGKTTIARCIAGLHAPAAGAILLGDDQLAPEARKRSREARRRLQFIFQNPYESLNPRHRVESLIVGAAMILRQLPREQAKAEAVRAIEEVRLPARVAGRFPGELSGGERQRVAIARALVADPDLLVCDEITSSLDVSVQAAILDLLDNLRKRHGLAMLFITHDLGVVASAADRVIVLDKGVICETGGIPEVLVSPSHSYTKLLLASAPQLAPGTVSVQSTSVPAR